MRGKSHVETENWKDPKLRLVHFDISRDEVAPPSQILKGLLPVRTILEATD
jgi:hypothetical protein